MKTFINPKILILKFEINFNNIMKHFWNAYIRYNIPFFILGGVALLLLIISWIAPPPMQVHESVLQGIAEIIGLAALWTVVIAIEKGTGASFRKGDVEVEIKEDHENKEEAEE